MALVKRIRSAWREQGALVLGYRASAALLRVLSLGRVRLAWYVLVAQPVRRDWRLPSRLGRSIEVRRVESGDPLLRQAARPASVVEDRFAQRAVCFAAVKEGRLAGFLWLCPEQYREDDVRALFVLHPSSEVWWDFDVWVAPEYRNGVAFMKLWQAAHEFLVARGGTCTVSRIVPVNVASMAAHARAGARGIGHVIFACGRHWQLALGARPALLHFSTGPRSVPRIVLDPTRRTRAAFKTDKLIEWR